MNIFHFLERRKYEDKVAAYHNDKSITYRTLYVNAVTMAKKYIKSRGIVGILMDNSIEFLVSFFAVQAADSTVFIINPALKQDEISKYVNFCKMNLIIAQKKYKACIEEITKGVQVIYYEDIQIKEESNIPIKIECKNKIAVIMPTSGTTDISKLVQLSHESLSTGLNSIQSFSGRDGETKELIISFYGSRLVLEGQILINICVGGTIVFAANLLTKKSFIEYVRKYGITHGYFVPTQLRMLISWDIPCDKMWTIKEMNIIGEHLGKQEMLKFVIKYPFIRLLYGYGLTETGLISYGECNVNHDGNVGKILPSVNVEIKSEDGEILYNEEEGEICVCKPYEIATYYGKSDEKTDYYKTGDVGYISKDGFLYIVGRKKNIINCMGRKIFPEEIEEIILNFKDVKEVLVYGRKNQEQGEIICAKIVAEENSVLDIKELKYYCQSKLADYKIPREFVICSELPKTISNKKMRKL